MLLFAKCNWNDHVKEDEKGRTCRTHGAKMNAYRIFVGKPEEKNHYEDQDVDGWTILKCILERQIEMV
jgi:hypothetical protein